MRDHIPKRATQLLQSFLKDELAEEVAGDLEEDFRKNVPKGKFRAQAGYWYQVINYLRPFAIRNLQTTHHNHYDMFQNYFKVSWRNLLRNKGYSFINIGGLALGMTISILIALWVYDEVTFDQYHDNYDDIVQVMQHQTVDGTTGSSGSMPMPVRYALQDEYGSDFVSLSLMSWVYNHVLSAGEVNNIQEGGFVEAVFPEMMTIRMVAGSRDALKDQRTILLSQSVARSLFGARDPLNQQIRLDNKHDLTVGGVYEDLPANSTFADVRFMGNYDFYAESESWLRTAKTQWYNNSFRIFARLHPGADREALSGKIKDLKIKHSPLVRAFNPQVFVYPMKDWHLRSEWKEGVNIGGRINLVWLFGLIGAFVLLLACINFMNLSTARSEKRAKEVGIRMSVGSVRRQLINQFLSESFMVVLFAFVLALGMVATAMPLFNVLAGKRIALPWSDVWFWVIGFIFVGLTSLLAGSYPALYLSSFKPVKVLKGTFKAGRSASLPRRVLVVIQFTVSVTLVIGTAIIYQQIQHSKMRPTGYDRSGMISIEMSTEEFHSKYETLRTELMKTGHIEEMCETSSPLWSVGSRSGGFSWEGKDPNAQLTDFGNIWVTAEFGKTVRWNILEGRDFSNDFPSDTTNAIINQAAVQFMGVRNPVGSEIKWGDTPYRIIAVVEDLVIESPYEPVLPIVYFRNDRSELQHIQIRLNASKTTAESLAAIGAVFRKNINGVPFDYNFVDDRYAQKFEAEERIGSLSYVFSTLAIIISCLGLFGLASFVAEQRTKEIGIRKVLGATLFSLWRMLSKDFVVLIITACFIAVPLAMYFLEGWLDKYEYRVEISWWTPVITVVGAIVITLATVSYQAIRSASMNPVNSLKSE